ncbi:MULTISPECIES: DUF423 domain-containing protein [Alteromonas]|jgi:uncharacterized membrane protein YgdD (TMEM256/DUF423 family)|uniref:DUF423 domain-containing protein n=1 Tax=Alteromonas TaxID=226 RepID=UPI0005C714E4|nr:MULTISPECIES: DUF423 domain-containing protein [Alteromonas]NQY15964.1 DUF423 domain-containing protein [Alteromonas sp.]|tara:strand:+ start:2372 stop:2824 length:453 start_codon:yes stop_codon:yes gene_type:complete
MKNENLRGGVLAKPFLLAGALFAGLAVILGAFAAHGLKGVLTAQQLSTFETGVRYQMYHALAVLLLPALSNYISSKWVNRVALCFVIGCVLFSGSLYALSISGIKWFGPITPLGGLFFIIGWALLLVGLLVTGNTDSQSQGNNLQGGDDV